MCTALFQAVGYIYAEFVVIPKNFNIFTVVLRGSSSPVIKLPRISIMLTTYKKFQPIFIRLYMGPS